MSGPRLAVAGPLITYAPADYICRRSEEGGSLGFRPPRTRTGSALRPRHGQTGMPSWVAAAGVPDPENVEPTKMPHEPGE